jgi:protein-tyrosine phosphatase
VAQVALLIAFPARWQSPVVARDLDWPYCVNIRDLGGLATADGVETAFGALIRADNVRRLTSEGWDKARAYGVRTVLDLRSAGERRDDALVPSDVEVVTVSLFDDFDSNAAYRADLGVRLSGADAAEQYRTLYSEALVRNADEFGNALGAIANAAEGGILIHCAGGKDRTGVLAALLLRIVDVPMPVVEADYERSEERLGIVDTAPSGVIAQVITALEEQHTSIEGYFRDLGVSKADVSRVRQRLLNRRAEAGRRPA